MKVGEKGPQEKLFQLIMINTIGTFQIFNSQAIKTKIIKGLTHLTEPKNNNFLHYIPIPLPRSYLPYDLFFFFFFFFFFFCGTFKSCLITWSLLADRYSGSIIMQIVLCSVLLNFSIQTFELYYANKSSIWTLVFHNCWFLSG